MTSKASMGSSDTDVLVVGHVTRDLIAGEHRLGGAASFAARAAALLGYRTALVTAAPAGDPLLQALQLPAITLHAKPTPHLTTFELDYSGPVRRIFLRAQATALNPDDLPESARGARIAYVAPVIGECGRAVMEALDCDTVVVGAQGWLRRVGRDGAVEPHLLDEALHPPQARAMVFSELDHPEAEALARRFAETAEVVALTRAAKGVTLFTRDRRIDVPSDPAREVDPTGAGDVFGTVLGLELSDGTEPVEAARRACRAAARVVEGPGMGRLPAYAAEVERRRRG